MFAVVTKTQEGYRPCGVRFSEDSSGICLFDTAKGALSWTQANPTQPWFCISIVTLNWPANNVVLEREWLQPVIMNTEEGEAIVS